MIIFELVPGLLLDISDILMSQQIIMQDVDMVNHSTFWDGTKIKEHSECFDSELGGYRVTSIYLKSRTPMNFINIPDWVNYKITNRLNQ